MVSDICVVSGGAVGRGLYALFRWHLVWDGRTAEGLCQVNVKLPVLVEGRRLFGLCAFIFICLKMFHSG